MAERTPGQPVSEAELRAVLAADASRGRRPAPPRVADLLATGAAGLACPDPRQLEALVAGRLARRKLPELARHLQGCPTCRRYVSGLREAARHPLSGGPARPVPGLATSHVVGLMVAGLLLLLANSAVLDLLDSVEAPAAAAAAASRPAPRALVTPAPVLAVPDTAASDVPEAGLADVPAAGMLAVPERGSGGPVTPEPVDRQDVPAAGLSEQSGADGRRVPDETESLAEPGVARHYE